MGDGSFVLDFEGLELRALASWCEHRFGNSALAADFRNGSDPVGRLADRLTINGRHALRGEDQRRAAAQLLLTAIGQKLGLENTRRLIRFEDHWAQRGYVAVFLQHPGSDDSVWKDKPSSQRLSAMKEAASLKNLTLRVQDVKVVLDQLQRWNNDVRHDLHNRLDLSHIGMSGHSFGAVTTQFLSGQRPPIGNNLTDPRIRAAVVMSPSALRRGDAKAAFDNVKIPWMLLTGTKDNSPIGDTDAASRLLVFSALPVGDKYELVLSNAEHSAFTDRALPGDTEPRNPNHHRAILAVTTAFWDSYLRNNPAAKAWLNGDAIAKILEPADNWQKK